MKIENIQTTIQGGEQMVDNKKEKTHALSKVEIRKRALTQLEGISNKQEEKLQKELMDMYYEKDYQDGVFEIISQTKNWASQDGRIKKYERVFEKKYDGPRVEKKEINNPTTESDFIRNALLQKDFAKAISILKRIDSRALLIRNESDKEYLTLCKKIVHRESEIVRELCDAEKFTEAKVLVDSITENEHHIEYNSKAGLKRKIDHLEAEGKKEKQK